MSDRYTGLASLGLPSCTSTVTQLKQNNGGKRKRETTCSYWNRNIYARYEHLPRVSLDQRKCHAGTCIKHKHPRACGRQRVGGGGGGGWRRGAPSVTASCSHYQCNYIRCSPPQRADMTGIQEDGIFLSAPPVYHFFLFFFPISPSPWPCTPSPPTPTPDAAGWTTTLDRRERADKSLHGDSAFCKSCCGRRVFSPLSLFPPPSTAAKLMLVHNPSLSFSSPLVHSCARSPASYQHFPVKFEKKNNEKNIKKNPFPVIDIITLASLLTASTQSQSPFITLLISQDKQERGGRRQDGEDIMFT